MQKIKITINITTLIILLAVALSFFNSHKNVEQSEVLGAFDSKQILPANYGPNRITKTVRQVTFDSLPSLSANSVLIYLPDYGNVLFFKNSNEKVPIASLTKLMTAIVASKQTDFDKPITITKEDRVNISPSLHLQVGDKVMPTDLVNAMLIGSANDAALTLANHLPDRNTFIAEMNDTAKNLGMNDTNFSTPIGFDDPGNYSTANDLKKLVDYALVNLKFDTLWQKNNYHFFSVSGKYYSVNASNDLISKHENIRAIKTGLTPEAKGNMIVEASSGDKKIILIVLGSDDRDKDTLNLIDYIFKNFSW